ncbi:Proteins containing regions of low-complexity [Ceraceosorus bombacis]|uniref:Proteins containing regions of low-complexity n=1 Tax=Ceraceosorus bombacis TaxID=401625 RepID=A0A0P1BHH4_9BASI|nr:Proteins containing regions of low-complexity [Ceraceosorus bombacis]
MIAFVPSSVRSYLRLDAPPDVGRLLEAYDIARYLTTFNSAAEVFALLSVSDVRRALIKRPQRVDLLIRLLIAHLEALVHDEHFCPRPVAAAKNASSGGPLGWISAGAGAGATRGAAGAHDGDGSAAQRRDRHKECLNCLRILTRIIPVILEGDHDLTCNASAEGEGNGDGAGAGAGDGDGNINHNPNLDTQSTSEGAVNNSTRASLNTDEFQKRLFFSKLRADELPPLGEVLTPRSHPSSHNASSATTQGQSSEDQFVIDDDDEEEEEQQQQQREQDEDATATTEIANGSAEQDPLSAHAAKVQASKQTRADSSTRDLDDDDDERKDATEPLLIERLLSLVIDLLFYSGFTIPWTPEQLSLPHNTPARESRVHYAIWEQGVGSSIELAGATRAHESARVELMRLLLVLLSRSIYVSAANQADLLDAALEYTSCKLDRSVVLPLLCSLLNTAVKHAADSGWLGGLGSLAAIPGGLVKDRLSGTAGVQENRAALVGLCLQTLDVILGYVPNIKDAPNSSASNSQSHQRPSLTAHSSTSSIASTSSDGPKNTSQAQASHTNAFRFYLSKMHRHSDFVLLSAGMFEMLSAKINSMGILPLASAAAPALTTGSAGDTGPGAHMPEALLLLWRLMTLNPRFRLFLLDDPVRAPLLLSRLLFHALHNKDSAAQQGLVRLCVFVLQDISSTPAFAAHISAAGSANRAKIPGGHKWGITAGGSNAGGGAGGDGAGSAADVLIQATYSLMATTKGSLSTLYAPLVISLANTAPAWTNITVLSSQRLVSLLSSFSAPSFLLADESHPRLVFFLLETINGVIHHHPKQNANLIYALLRNHKSVYRLVTFTLRKGVAEIRRNRMRADSAFANIGARIGQLPVAPNSGTTTPVPSHSPSAPFLSPRALGADAKDPLAAAAAPGATAEATVTAPTASNAPPGDEEKARMLHRDEEESSRLAQLTLDEGVAQPGGVRSEKARGKMREQESISLQEDTGTGVSSNASAPHASSEFPATRDEAEVWAESLTDAELQLAAENIGRNGFVPTQPWIASWQKGLPLDSLQILLGEVLPKLNELVKSDQIRGKSDADSRVCAWIREVDLDRVLPQKPPVYLRPFKWNEQARIWILSYLWGLVYVSAQLPYGIYTGTSARLFQLRTPNRRTAQAASTTNRTASPSNRGGAGASA